jgi:predicted SnoaL-like aldol condensation-catalyzing enzyme
MNRGLRVTAGAVLALLLTGAAPPDNRAIVTDFARLFYTERNVRAAFQRYVSDHYIQHNPGLPDGREPAIVALTPKFTKPGASFEIKRIVVDGDMAVIHVHARPEPASRGAAVVDMYRLERGKIVEHWDVIQPVPEQSQNAHPMF